MRFDGVNLNKIIFFSSFSKFVHTCLQNLIKKYKISEDILKTHYIVNRMTFCLIKSNENYLSYYLNSTTVELYFSKDLILSNEVSNQTFLIDIDCLK